jgi:large subunit ribosomal protein L25
MELTANTREITGKKVRFLRRQGITPVHVFGHGIEPLAVQCDTLELKKVLSQAGATHIISLKLDKAKKPRSVMVREVQKNAITGELVHVDLYQVRMEEKLKVIVPLVLVGEAPALKLKENFLAHELDRVEIECLPDAIPGQIDVDISGLAAAEQSVHVRDLKLGNGIVILNNPSLLIAKISLRSVEKEEAAAAPAAAEAAAAEPAAEATKEKAAPEKK